MLNLSSINTNTLEGRFLMAALAKLTTENHPDKTSDEVLSMLDELQAHMYQASPLPSVDDKPKTFQQELAGLINRHSLENVSNTPDFVLAQFMDKCLKAFNTASYAREAWYGQRLTISNKNVPLEKEMD
jgi:hypothetical protein